MIPSTEVKYITSSGSSRDENGSSGDFALLDHFQDDAGSSSSSDLADQTYKLKMSLGLVCSYGSHKHVLLHVL